jgi:ATP-dependent 26S proteasome regulatory subunit
LLAVNFQELARSTDEFNGAQLKVKSFNIFALVKSFNFLKAVCVEAGMSALKKGAVNIGKLIHIVLVCALTINYSSIRS